MSPRLARPLALGSALTLTLMLTITTSRAAPAMEAPPAVLRAPVLRADLTDLGRATGTTRVDVTFALRYRNQAELDRLVRLQSDRRSPLYHRFLTPAQFAAAFGPAPAEYARLAVALEAAGFRVSRAFLNRTLLDAVATAPVAERFFGTQIHRVAQFGHGLRYANVTPAHLPDALVATVRSFSGTDDVVKLRSARLRADRSASDLAVPDAESPDLSGPISYKPGGTFAGLFPTAIAKAYDFPTQAGYDGAGQAIAIVMDSDIDRGDLETFWQTAKIHRQGNVNRVYVEGSNPGVTADVGETAIDVELASSLARQARIDLYLPPDLSDKSVEDAYNEAVSADADGVVSSSFGGCELDDTPFNDATNAIAEQGASEGISFTASTGDAGGYCEDQNAQGGIYFRKDVVSNPASNPYFTAVGATTLVVNGAGARVSETSWGPGGANGGGGGGVSSYWPIPDYQSGLAGMAVVPAVANAGPLGAQAGFAGRNLPDISLDGSNRGHSYMAIYDTPEGGWVGYGGTSVSNPEFAAYITDVNGESGGNAGFINPALYAAYADFGYQYAFYDVTSGSIGAGWSATAGYDQATGIGSLTGSLP